MFVLKPQWEGKFTPLQIKILECLASDYSIKEMALVLETNIKNIPDTIHRIRRTMDLPYGCRHAYLCHQAALLFQQEEEK